MVEPAYQLVNDMDKMTVGAILLIVGVAILVESVFADGIGVGNLTSFGRTQTIGTILGVILTGGGLFVMIKSRKDQ
jgi:hypothetical protein